MYVDPVTPDIALPSRYHWSPEPVELSTTDTPLHNNVEPPALTSGADGVAFVVRTILLDDGDVPQLLEAVDV